MRLFLVKMVERKEYASSLLRGELYANRLACFRKFRGDKEREDDLEGVIQEPPGSRLELEGTDLRTGETGKVIVPTEDMADRIRRQIRSIDSINVFCTYSVDHNNLEKVPNGNADRQGWRIGPSEVFSEFGEHAVVIWNPHEFIERVEAAAQRQGYAVSHGHVQYYDPETGPQNIDPEVAALFAKRNTYAHQKEHRIAINTGTIGSDPLRLSIGDISDIALYFNVNNMDRELSIITQDR